MKKLIGLWMGVLLVLGLVSCNNEKKIEGDEDDGDKTIVFYHMLRDESQALNKAIEQFEETYPGWTIESENLFQYDVIKDAVLEAKETGRMPDLVYCLPEHVAQYKEQSMIVDLNPYIKDAQIGFTTEQENDFVKGFYEEGKSYGDGAMYSLPFLKQTEVIYTTKTLYPANWEALELFQDKSTNTYTIGVDSSINLFMTMTAQLQSEFTSVTGEHFTFDNSTNRGFVEMLKSWYESKLFVTAKAYNVPYLSLNGVDYLIGATTGAAFQNRGENIKVAPIPTFAGKELKVPFSGSSLCMLKQKSKARMEKTWLFMKDFLLTAEAQAAFSIESGYNPVLKSTYDVPAYAAWLMTGDGSSYSQGIVPLVALVCSSYVDSYWFPAPFVGCEKAKTEAGQLIDDVLMNVKSVDQAFKDAVSNCKK